MTTRDFDFSHFWDRNPRGGAVYTTYPITGYATDRRSLHHFTVAVVKEQLGPLVRSKTPQCNI